MQDVHKYCTEMLVTDRGAERVRPATWEVKTRVALKSYLNLVFSKGLASDKEIGIECILNAEWLVQWLQWMLSGESRAGMGWYCLLLPITGYGLIGEHLPPCVASLLILIIMHLTNDLCHLPCRRGPARKEDSPIILE